MLVLFFQKNKEYRDDHFDDFLSLKKKYWIYLWSALFLIFPVFALAIISGKTAAIYGHPPEIQESKFYLLLPDGVTLIKKNELLHPSDIPNELKLFNKKLTLVDKDGDLGLNARINFNDAEIIWMDENERELTESEKSKELKELASKYYKVRLKISVEVSSTTGIPSKSKFQLEKWLYKKLEVGIAPRISEIKNLTTRDVIANGKDVHLIKVMVRDQRDQPVSNQQVFVSAKGDAKVSTKDIKNNGREIFIKDDTRWTNGEGKLIFEAFSHVAGSQTLCFGISENECRFKIDVNFVEQKR